MLRSLGTLCIGAVLALAAICCGTAVAQESPAESAAKASAGLFRHVKGPIRPWQDYPFIKAPERQLRTQLWQNFDELPDWAQRGRMRYLECDGKMPEKLKTAVDMRAVAHVGPIRSLTEADLKMLDDNKVPLVIRLDGQYFWGRDYPQMMEILRPGGWSVYHVTVPNTMWHTKFPPSLSATKLRRDGELYIGYYINPWTQRRDLSYVHPVGLQMRDAFLRECVVGEQVFDIPLDLIVGGRVSGVWWDNPGTNCVSYDAYAGELMAREFAKKFGQRYKDPVKHVPYYGDPMHFSIVYHDREVMKWYERFWADAYAGYYAKQYQILQDELAPKLGKKHLFVGGNFKVGWSMANWDYYLFSWPNVLDCMGPCESTAIYSNKDAANYKLALAASNGKPTGVWVNRANPTMRAEVLACLATLSRQEPTENAFHMANETLYHNAMPGGRIAVLYHLADGIHHSEIANLDRVCDQVWQAGCPLEVITELHLTPEVLKGFDMLVVPGFQFDPREVDAIKSYLQGGGKVLLVGDNRDADGRQLSEALGGVAAFTDGQAVVGKGSLQTFGRQLITQAEMTSAIENFKATSYRVITPGGEDVMLNVLAQPKGNFTTLHLLNYTQSPIKDVKVRMPEELKAQHVALITPRGRHQVLTVQDNTLTIPLLEAYVVAVICPDAASRDEILAGNKVIADLPALDKLWEIKVPKDVWATQRVSQVRQEQIEQHTLAAGQRLSHLRQNSRAGYHRLDLDVATQGTGTAGKSQEIRLMKHLPRGWAENIQFDQRKIVAVHLDSDAREEVPVEIEPAGPAKPDWQPAAQPGKGVWTPAKAGRYQLYFSYRYVNASQDGMGDTKESDLAERYNRDAYMSGRPVLKPVYEDLLPCMVVDVAGQ